MTVQLPFDQAHPLDVAPLLRQRSEEHTSELQSQSNLVCRLLLEKKKIQRRDVSRFCSAIPTPIAAHDPPPTSVHLNLSIPVLAGHDCVSTEILDRYSVR